MVSSYNLENASIQFFKNKVRDSDLVVKYFKSQHIDVIQDH